MGEEGGFLTREELATLTAICDTLIPAIEGEEPAELFRRGASDLGVPELVAQGIALADPAQRAQFRQLLGLFDNRLANAVLAGQFRRFGDLAPEAREACLRGWAESGIGQRRMGFQALKRLACFIFYSAHGANGNPVWPAIGYEAPAAPPQHRPREIRTVDVTGDVTFEAEVCVVGSGAGGAVVAAELAAAGHAVLVLEKGGYFDEADFRNRELEGMRDLYLDHGMAATRNIGMSLLAGSCLGGGTVINDSTCIRPPLELLEEWERPHGVSGLTGPDMQASLDAVEARLHVNDAESRHNANNAVLARGCEALGYKVGTVRRNVQGCKKSGFCNYGCQEGAKQSALVTFLRDAQRRGAHFVVNCDAERVRHQGGRVTGVEARAKDAATDKLHRITVQASTVVLAAGGINTPAILMRSGLSHPALGRHLHLHPIAAVLGIFPEPIEPWKGAAQTAYCDHFSRADGPYGFMLEMSAAHPGLAGLGLPWHSGVQHKRRMLKVRHTAVMIAITRDRDTGRIALSKAGNPIVEYWPSAYDSAQIARGQYEAARVLAAAGALEVETLHTPAVRWAREDGEAGLRVFGGALAQKGVHPNRLFLVSAHQMGSCRMGGDRRRTVANPEGEIYGLRGLFVADGSVFPSASGVNPMISIMGLAHRTAQFVKARL
ncbi:MAG: GMC family oxidoreductase N-terminal domain-containing protein [Chloroflexi bacterium]|nr:GMC family oxidoreductase N-terminal domain-containing protein [Chloroflexota bacterium]